MSKSETKSLTLTTARSCPNGILKCTASTNQVTNLAKGFQTVAGSFTTMAIGPFTFSGAQQLPIIGFQAPGGASCTAIMCPPSVVQTSILRVCNGSLVVGGVIESTLRLTPILSGPAFGTTVLMGVTTFVTVPITILGTPIPVIIQEPFQCVIEQKCADQCACVKSKYEICSATLCPIVNCLADTVQVALTAVAAGGSFDVTGTQVCAATSFLHRNAVSIRVKRLRRKVNTSAKLASLTPACVNFSNVITTLGATPAEPCIVLNGCNLDKVVAVLFDGVCGSIFSSTDTSITVRVPCAVSVSAAPSAGAFSFPQVSVSVVDNSGNTSNALQLQIGCPTS